MFQGKTNYRIPFINNYLFDIIILLQIIIRLPDDAEVSNELWDEVIECMKLRVNDKVPAIRTFAIRALSRFLNDLENSDILELFLDKLPSEPNAVSLSFGSPRVTVDSYLIELQIFICPCSLIYTLRYLSACFQVWDP